MFRRRKLVLTAALLFILSRPIHRTLKVCLFFLFCVVSSWFLNVSTGENVVAPSRKLCVCPRFVQIIFHVSFQVIPSYITFVKKQLMKSKGSIFLPDVHLSKRELRSLILICLSGNNENKHVKTNAAAS